MAEPFKNQINAALLRTMASHLARVWPAFPEARFLTACLEGLDALELKERVTHVRAALEACLPNEFPTAVAILERSLAPAPEGEDLGGLRTGPEGLAGWPVWPMTDYVAVRGTGHPVRALAALREMTQRFSSEFAIRSFLDRDPEGTLRVVKTWVHDSSPHVRRLASEGTRPRLPWGLRLQRFVADPSPCLPILEALYRDPSEYVRRSVANHLNDISKDHPDLAVEIAGRWLKSGDAATRKLVSHALRGLVKAGFPPALTLLGFNGHHGIEASGFKLTPKTVALGRSVAFSCRLRNTATRRVRLAVDYRVHHVKADGRLTPKVFKGSVRSMEPGETIEVAFTHSLKRVTTRRYHAGRHRLELLVNGRMVAGADFRLTLPA
ncbi:hypothetical protein GALL_96220 [mine drainage metagenome]|uniref:DNA alkylation repair enzyme n=1 Tax=mine drainage metagenome TaxID=410659 RepID=A0A1J5SI75_9ZZZZ